MSDYVFGDKFGGDKIGRDKNVQTGGSGNTWRIDNSQGVSPAELDAAVDELQAFVAQLIREGVVAADGSVTDPGAVVTAVRSRPGRLRAVSRAVVGGATEAVLAGVRGGVAALVAALVGGT
ncbi:hypothetical protein AB0G73_07610 [Streptomyces sp. NPDC020719]|uniref:hypothetical protein n=1 Tax=Streptomyces sp. NPDC020719 TaxID=3154896 RepID=UPI0034104333